MAHELSIREDGSAEMAYVGDVPWHHLGTMLPLRASKERWRKAAGFDHEILAQSVTYEVGGETYTCTDRLMLYRSDNSRPLGIVSADYKVVQPDQVLDFFDDLVKAGNMTLETAGTLFGGKQYWALAKLGEEAVRGIDRIKGYLLLSTSCDGSRKTVSKLTSVRVVCDNTLRMSDNKQRDIGGAIEVSHRSHFNADAVKQALGVAPKTFAEFMGSLERLSRKRLAKKRAETFTEQVFGEETRAARHVMDLFGGEATGYDMPGFSGTCWGWVNAVSEYVDWHAFAKTDSHRISNSLLGRGDQRKRQAYEIALDYAT